jgi:hypothetical protein
MAVLITSKKLLTPSAKSALLPMKLTHFDSLTCALYGSVSESPLHSNALHRTTDMGDVPLMISRAKLMDFSNT